MAIRYAITSGSWSDPAIWDGGTLPTTGDDVYSNNFRVIIDVATIDAAVLTNGSNVSPAINSGGGFNCNVSCQIDAEIRWANSTNVIANHLLLFNGTSTISVIINGTITPGTVAATTAQIVRSINPNLTLTYNGGTLERPGGNIPRYFIVLENGGTATINANVIQNLGANSAWILLSVGTGSRIIVNGNITQNSGNSLNTPLYSSIGNIEVYGDYIVNVGQAMVYVITATTTTHTVTHIGNIIFNTAGVNLQVVATVLNNSGLVSNWMGSLVRNLGSGIATSVAGTYNWTTNVIGDNLATTHLYIISSTNIVLNLTGNVIGGNVQSAVGIFVETAAVNPTLNIWGNLQGGNFNSSRSDLHANALRSFCSTLTLDGDITVIGSDNSQSYGIFVQSTQNAFIQRAITGAAPFYTSPYAGGVRFKSSLPEIVVSKQDNTVVTLSDPALQDYPSINDVRDGVEYGFLSYEGTLSVPLPSQVSLGTPTDNTVGTGIVTSNDFLEAIKTSSDPLAERLRNVATVQTVGDQFNSF
jgi:hypothetical protein